MNPKKRNKGQFLIVCAVMIIIILHMLSTTLIQTQKTESYSVQDNNPVWLIEATEKGLYQIAMKNLTNSNDIEEYINMQKEVARENEYILEVDITFTPYPDSIPYPNRYTIIEKSDDFYIEKSDKLLPYYADCKIAEDSSLCSGLDLLAADYQKTCCRAYALCC